MKPSEWIRNRYVELLGEHPEKHTTNSFQAILDYLDMTKPPLEEALENLVNGEKMQVSDDLLWIDESEVKKWDGKN